MKGIIEFALSEQVRSGFRIIHKRPTFVDRILDSFDSWIVGSACVVISFIHKVHRRDLPIIVSFVSELIKII